MAYSDIPNYKERYFENKTLTKVHGLHKIDTILEVFKQLKRNAHRVPTTLGGEQFGYLFLVHKAITYAAIHIATAITRPKDPGPFYHHAKPNTSSNTHKPTPSTSSSFYCRHRSTES